MYLLVAILAITQLSSNQSDSITESGFEKYTCGHVSVYALARLKQRNVEFAAVQHDLGPGRSGQHSLDELAQAGKSLGFTPLSLHVSDEDIINVSSPFIAHVRRLDLESGKLNDHFVVVTDVNSTSVQILDPPFAYSKDISAFKAIWSGNVLLFCDNPDSADAIIANLNASNSATWFYGAIIAALLSFVCVLGSNVAFIRATLHRWSLYVMHHRRLTRVLRSVCIVVIATIVGWQLLTPSPAILEFDARVISLGVLPPGNASRTVRLANHGSQPLVISEVSSSCSCVTVASAAPVRSSGEGVLEFDVRVVPGAGKADLLIKSNDPRGPQEVSLVWYGSSAGPRVVPAVVMASATDSAPLSKVVSVVVPGGSSSEIRVVGVTDRNGAAVTAHVGKQYSERLLSPYSPSGGLFQYRDIELTIKSARAHVKTVYSITVECANKTYVLRLPVELKRENSLRCEPENVVFLGLSHDTSARKRVSIRHPSTDTIDDLCIVDCPDWAECRLSENSETETTIEVKLRNISKTDVRRGTIEISFRDSRFASVNILSLEASEVSAGWKSPSRF